MFEKGRKITTQGALDAHAPPLVAALAKVSDYLTPLFAILVATPP